MEYRVLGRTGIRVTPLCLGTMMFGRWGNPDHADSIRIIHRALDAGINFVDTADQYAGGETEEIVGKALAGSRRDRVILTSKFHWPMSDDPNERGNSRRWAIRALDDSLRRLNTDWIDLYQVHRPDPDTDIDETLGALTDMVRAGKVRSIGTSGFAGHQLVEAQWVAERRGRERFATEQPPYSMLVRGVEANVLAVCEQYNLGVLSWGPLCGGWLAGGYRHGRELPSSHREDRLPWRYDMTLEVNKRKLDAADALGRLADDAGLDLIHLALAFVMRHPAVTSAIVGPRTMDHLEKHLGALDVVLTDEVLDRIDEIVPPGTTINPADYGQPLPQLQPDRRRRPA